MERDPRRGREAHPISMTFTMTDTGDRVQASTSDDSKKPGKRGRRSAVPREERESTRRIKKQRMERRRRACISDKMTALHNLAVALVGQDPQYFQRAEKADILNNCLGVLQGLANLVQEKPELRSAMRKIGSNIRRCSHSTGETPPLDAEKENGQLHPCSTSVQHSAERSGEGVSLWNITSSTFSPLLSMKPACSMDSGYYSDFVHTPSITGSGSILSDNVNRQTCPNDRVYSFEETRSTPIKSSCATENYIMRPPELDDEDTEPMDMSRSVCKIPVWRPYLD